MHFQGNFYQISGMECGEVVGQLLRVSVFLEERGDRIRTLTNMIATPPLPEARLTAGTYFSQIVIPFNTEIVSPSWSFLISVKEAKQERGRDRPSLFSPRSLRALIFRFSGSRYPPAGAPFSSLRRSKSFFCANSKPSLPSVRCRDPQLPYYRNIRHRAAGRHWYASSDCESW